MVQNADTESYFEGVYVSHWEIGRFAVIRGRRLFGLRPRVEKLYPHFPSDFGLPPLDFSSPDIPVRYYRMRVRGHLGPKGHFGHMGICRHELFISKVINCEETDNPGPTWR